jgi:hypothetical protein
MQVAIYVGAGLDFSPVYRLNWIQQFIYIDSQPLTEFGSLEQCKEFSRPEFEVDLLATMRAMGHVTRMPNSNLIILNLPGARQVLYYINTCFPDISPTLSDLIKTASVLICCGHTPDALILTLMKPGPKIFIGDSKTLYCSCCCCCSCSNNNLVNLIQQEPSIFELYIKINCLNGDLTHHLTIQELSQ